MASILKKEFPPVRACLFDMDGLLIDSEDKYTICTNILLARYDRPKLPWWLKAQMQGRPGPASGALFTEWAKLPITREQYQEELLQLQADHFPTVKALPGVETLLSSLKGAYASTQPSTKLEIALATSSHQATFKLKTAHLEDLLRVFTPELRVLGDDPRIPPGRGKPAPEIYLLALKLVNESLAEGEARIKPEECLVFEDSVPGVESGRRAGMRVVWCPHPELKKEYEGREELVLAGRTGSGGDADMHQVGEVGDGWADYYPSLENFPYEKYGIVV